MGIAQRPQNPTPRESLCQNPNLLGAFLVLVRVISWIRRSREPNRRSTKSHELTRTRTDNSLSLTQSRKLGDLRRCLLRLCSITDNPFIMMLANYRNRLISIRYASGYVDVLSIDERSLKRKH